MKNANTSQQPLTIWCNASFPDEPLSALRQAVLPHRLIFAQQLAVSNLHAAPVDPALAEADVLFGQPEPDGVMQSTRVKWVHITSAGYTRYDTASFKQAMRDRQGFFTNSSSVYDLPCAQHALAMMLALARQLPFALDDQRGQRTWPDGEIRRRSHLLNDQLVLIYGFGAIARTLVEYLKPLGMNITGVRRSTETGGPVPMVSPEAADALLSSADHVMNILPASPSTEHFFNAERLAKLSATACFYNIGRGATVDQQALVKLLQTRQIAAAYLDVMSPEPLPRDHILWGLDNCFITPHAAGGHADEHHRLVHHFLANLRRYTAGETLIDLVPLK